MRSATVQRRICIAGVVVGSTRTCLATTVRCAVGGLVEGFTPIYTPFLTEEVTQFSQSDEASKAAQAN